MTTSGTLNRSIGLKLAIIIVVGNIIGSGVYKKVAPMAADLNASGWILICWVLGGLVTMMGALSNAELAGMMADTGGEYTYYKKIYGRFFSFLYGWSNFSAIKTAAIAGIAYVFAQSVDSLFFTSPLLQSWSNVNILGIFYPFQDFNTKLTAILLILVLTIFNSRGIKGGAGLTGIIITLIAVGIALVVVFGLSSPAADISAGISLHSTSDEFASTIGFNTVFTAMLAAFWGYEGWNSVGFLGGEIKDPNKNIPKSIVMGLSCIITIYFLANLAYLSLLSIPDLHVINDTKSITAVEAVRKFWGETGAVFMAVLILISTLGCTHATIYSHARICYAMAKEGVFFKKAAKLNRFSVPGNALWIQAVWASLLILSGSFDQITDMLIFAAFIYYGATTLGVFILRYKMPNAHRPYKTWGYPVLPALFILFCVLLVGNTIIERPREAGIGLSLIALGIPFYCWFTRKK